MNIKKISLLKKAYSTLKKESVRALVIKYKNYTHLTKNGFRIHESSFNPFVNTTSLPIISENSSFLRVNILTDSIQENSVFGGVATSIIFAILLANKLQCPLRIITRTGYNASILVDIAAAHGIVLPENYELQNFSYTEKTNRLPVSKEDVFISTSWWSSQVIREINIRKKYIYILQEYEKIFYPCGDEHVMIDAIFKDSKMLPVVNTKLLYDFFKINNYEHIANTALFFEPSFPYAATVAHFVAKKQYNLFFYARPNAPRNLYYTGLRLINNAIKAGIIDTKEWKICFAGQEVHKVKFIDGVMPEFMGKLKLKAYTKLISTIDLGISLMCAPCPSYPPLDLAASGAVVLTNQYKSKVSLDCYSKNIICSELNDLSLLEGLRKAIVLAKNAAERERNYKANLINKKWEISFSEILNNLSDKIKKEII